MRVVMTGATSGIGLEAARVLIERDAAALTIGVRSPAGVPGDLAGADIHTLDLASLASVETFAADVGADDPIDVLVLNAGLQTDRRETSEDGFELTFAVNHLAHYLLARRLIWSMAPGGRIIFTSSGTHDPEEGTPIAPPRHADARWLAYPDTDPGLDKSPGTAGRRAYSTSKLCNVMTAREMRRRYADARPDLAWAAYDPGFTPGTGLTRSYAAPVRFIFETLLPLLAPLNLNERASTPKRSGSFLAMLAAGRDARFTPGADHYFSVRGHELDHREPSVLARDAEACRKLWDDSAALLGMEP